MAGVSKFDGKTSRGIPLYVAYGFLVLAILIFLVVLVAWVSYGSYEDSKASSAPFDFGNYLGSFSITFDRFGVIDVALISVALGFYLLPTFIAIEHRHNDRVAIALANVCLGFTGVGWIACLGWAFTPPQGMLQTLSDLGKRTAPEISRIVESSSDIGSTIQKHPLVREAARNMDRALGGKLHIYAVPGEGVESLISGVSASRAIDGAVQIACRLNLPAKTLLRMDISALNSHDSLISLTCELQVEGWLRQVGLTNAGRPFSDGLYRVRIATLPFEFGVQPDWIVDAVGEHGKLLPSSATLPVDPEFPQYGRQVVEERIVDFGEVSVEARQIECVKLAVLTGAVQRPRSVEDSLRDRLAAREDEVLDSRQPWSVEKVGEGRFVVSLLFSRRKRAAIARWEVFEPTQVVRYLDPDAKAFSGA